MTECINVMVTSLSVGHYDSVNKLFVYIKRTVSATSKMNPVACCFLGRGTL